MINRDIFQKDPSTRKLVNEGVANVNDENTSQALDVLRYELETFVCDGQYEKGLAHILEVYLKNIDQAQQSAVWISGFYGSGKSHMVKMLRALWVDTVFADGATARGIANLPRNINDLLKELSVQGKRHGGLHGFRTGAGASGSVRLAMLRLIFKSAGLPEQYPIARFIMWLKQEGIYDKVRQDVISNGYKWEEELDNFYVAEGLHQALVKAKPQLFTSPGVCLDTLNNLYPHVNDISSDEMLKAINQTLTRESRLPLTLIVLDEVQQYIGEDSQRSMDVQEVVEACCKKFGGKLLFIGTGQTAITGTSNLKKLEGRFTVRVELSDADVDAVIRKVILAKPEAKSQIEQMMQTNLGEISRHLAGTTICHRQEDIAFFLRITRSCPFAAASGNDPAGSRSDRHRQPAAQSAEHDSQGHSDQSRCRPRQRCGTCRISILIRPTSFCAPHSTAQGSRKTMTWNKGNADERPWPVPAAWCFSSTRWQPATRKSASEPTSTRSLTCWSKISRPAPAPCAANCPGCSKNVNC